MIFKIFEITATVIDIVFLVWFSARLNRFDIRKKKRTLAVPALLLVFQLIMDNLLPGYDIVYMAVVLVMSVLYNLLICDKKYWRGILSGAGYVAVLMLAASALTAVMSIFLKDFGVIMQGEESYARLVYLAIGKTVQFLFFRLVLLIFRTDEGIDRRNGIMTFAFTFLTAFGLSSMMHTAANANDAESHASVVMTVVILVAANFLMYYMVYNIQKLQKEKYELKLISDITEFQKKNSEEAAAIWSQIRQVRHDIKNHLTVISGELNEGNVEGCKKYLSDLEATVNTMGNMIKSNNPVIDYLVNTKLSGLDGIEVVITGFVGDFSDVEDSDLACILGNILDNAIEAQKSVEGEKKIELAFRENGKDRVIVCKNTVAAPVLANNKELKSTKKDPSSHGLGHIIVTRTVEKYGGMVDWFDLDGMFGVQIILPRS